MLSDEELAARMLVMGPLGPTCSSSYHPNTMIIYFLLDPVSKPRLAAAIRGHTPEKAPLFGTQRSGDMGTIDQFWTANIAKETIAGAVQFIPLDTCVVITHMAVRSNWRRLGINARLIDCIKKEFSNKQLVFQDVTSMGQKFVEGY